MSVRVRANESTHANAGSILYSKLKFKSCPIEKFCLFSQFSLS